MRDVGSTPIPKTLVFLSLAFVLVSAADPNVSLPFRNDDGDLQQNVTLGDKQKEIQGETDTPGAFEGIFLRTSCILTLGISELIGDACSEGFEGTLEGLKDVTIIGTVVEGMDSFVSMVGRLMTFNVPGAPTEVRFVIGISISGTIAYSVVRVLRGGG